jgi:hypothetical protein
MFYIICRRSGSECDKARSAFSFLGPALQSIGESMLKRFDEEKFRTVPEDFVVGYETDVVFKNIQFCCNLRMDQKS